MRLSELYEKDPKLALDFKFEKAKSNYSDRVFLWTGLLGTCGKTKYGSYKYVTRADLEGRQYDIEFWDYDVTIFYTDALFDARNNKHVPK